MTAFDASPQPAYKQLMKHKKPPRPEKQRSQKRPKNTQKPSKNHQHTIYGAHSVMAALQNPARKIIKLSVTENAAHRYLDDLKNFSEKLTVTKASDLDRMVGQDAVHQGLVLEAGVLPDLSLEEAIERASTSEKQIFVVLDQITDPHNVGAILRSCSAFSVAAVIVPARNSVEYSGVLAKAASGAVEHVPLVRVTNLARALNALKDAHISVVGFDSELAEDFQTVCDLQRVALIFGAEGKGMRRLTRENCDHLVRLDTTGAIKSLNVSNACAVALYTLSSTKK